ncbi:hypothetical protein MTR67_048455 [Solanum verrucosum]|uniref:Uncharacterized protein n=1 Tax=Solanum verrucosum TaxID=315347 RepID=A0AAF0ZZL5_SOLVR|nr:hypothetical protein MTR67_048455 [Solanum verrucosum]
MVLTVASRTTLFGVEDIGFCGDISHGLICQIRRSGFSVSLLDFIEEIPSFGLAKGTRRLVKCFLGSPSFVVSSLNGQITRRSRGPMRDSPTFLTSYDLARPLFQNLGQGDSPLGDHKGIRATRPTLWAINLRPSGHHSPLPEPGSLPPANRVGITSFD